MRVIVVVAASSWALCSRPGSLSVTGAKPKPSDYSTTYLGAFGENKCPGGGEGPETAAACEKMYSEYCPAPGRGCGYEGEFSEIDNDQLPPGCSVDATKPLYALGDWMYFDAQVYFNNGSSASFPSDYKKLCTVNLLRFSIKTTILMNWERWSLGGMEPLTISSELTQTAFAVALNVYKNLTAGHEVKKGYSFRDGWDGDFIVDNYDTWSWPGDVVIYRGLARKCNSGTEAKFATSMVKDAFAKKAILRKRLYSEKYTRVGSARICTGRKGKSRGSIEVVMFAQSVLER